MTLANEKTDKTIKIKKVIKLGGSCLKDRSSLIQAVSIIKQEREKVALVISALSSVTDLLIDAYHLALGQEKNFRGIISAIQERHLTLASEVLSLERHALLAKKYQELFLKLNRLLQGISLSGETSPSLKASVLSYGERFSVWLIASVLEEKGLSTRVYESEKIGLVSRQISEEAVVDLPCFDYIFMTVSREVEGKNFIPIITGFYGITEEGKTVLFGRNGSDYTAACIARGFKASTLLIYKDVPGFLTADPDLVPEAQLVSSLSRGEAAELSYFGAKILHPRLWEPLENLDCQVEIRSFQSPGVPGTVIKPQADKNERIIKSFSMLENLAILRVEGPGVGIKPGIIGRIGLALADKGINILTVLTSQTAINLLLNEPSAEPAFRVLRQLNEPVIRNIIFESGLALIAAVGQGLRETGGIASRIFYTLASAGVNVEFFSTGASETAIYLLVKSVEARRAIKILHQAFFG